MAAGGSVDTGACDHYIVGRAFITVDNENVMDIDPLEYAVGIKNKSAVNGSSVEPSDRIYLWLLHLATPICVTELMTSDDCGAAANTTDVCTGVILLEALLIHRMYETGCQSVGALKFTCSRERRDELLATGYVTMAMISAGEIMLGWFDPVDALRLIVDEDDTLSWPVIYNACKGRRTLYNFCCVGRCADGQQLLGVHAHYPITRNRSTHTTQQKLAQTVCELPRS